MSIENKHPQTPTDPTELSVADDLLTVIDLEDQEARGDDERGKAFQQFQAGKITRDEYNAIVQAGAPSESQELRRQEEKQAALDRINDGQPQRLGHRVMNLLRRK